MKRVVNSSLALITAITLYTIHDTFAHPSAIAEAAQPQFEPFTYRAPLDPFKIHQLPDFMMHLRERKDFVVQRSVFPPGAGGWHSHAGSSFVYVIEGQIKLQKFTGQEGCFETPVYGPGQAYFEVGNEVHRAVVVSEESAVVMVVRFNMPEGGPIGIPASDPGCPTEILVPAEAPLNEPPHTADSLEKFIAQQVTPFTFRSTLDPFTIHQLPDFLMHSNDQTDLVIQRSVFAPGTGPWHYHPGPSFIYVIDGQIKLRKFSEKEGCFETQVYGPGQSYFEIGNQVHRSIVVSEGSAVLMVVRFLPVGAPITILVPAPECF
jgi:quercetin dioxygenase-like cupin family protein